MIEFEHYRIALATIDTSMLDQILINLPGLLLPQSISALAVPLFIKLVV